jgi:hypothetical protein
MGISLSCTTRVCSIPHQFVIWLLNSHERGCRAKWRARIAPAGVLRTLDDVTLTYATPYRRGQFFRVIDMFDLHQNKRTH